MIMAHWPIGRQRAPREEIISVTIIRPGLCARDVALSWGSVMTTLLPMRRRWIMPLPGCISIGGPVGRIRHVGHGFRKLLAIAVHGWAQLFDQFVIRRPNMACSICGKSAPWSAQLHLALRDSGAGIEGSIGTAA